jgi:hypothetical protein
MVRVANEGGQRLTIRVPQPRRFVVRGCEDPAGIGREYRMYDKPIVALERGEGLPSASHSRAVPSQEAVRMRRLSGENTALTTLSPWASVASGARIPATEQAR